MDVYFTGTEHRPNGNRKLNFCMQTHLTHKHDSVNLYKPNVNVLYLEDGSIDQFCEIKSNFVFFSKKLFWFMKLVPQVGCLTYCNCKLFDTDIRPYSSEES